MPIALADGSSHVLVLGGTTEAGALVAALAGSSRFTVTLSLAGRTASPKAAPVPTRVGGFGGSQGLAEWIVANRVARVVDATHPFAARISANAAQACVQTRTPLLAIRRPAWDRIEGDHWIEVADTAAAADALGETPRKVFLTIGRQDLATFARAPQHTYHVRTIEPVDGIMPVPRLTEINARGPFTREAEIAFLREAGIEVIVSKNAGGAATYAKIEAARQLGLTVVMVRRPNLPDVPSVADAQAALDRLLGQR